MADYVDIIVDDTSDVDEPIMRQPRKKDNPVKKKRGRPTGSKNKKLQSGEKEAAKNREYIERALEVRGFSPINTNDIGQVEKRIELYLNWCYTKSILPTWEGLAHSLKVSRTTLRNWQTGKTKGDSPRYREAINEVSAFMEQIYAEAVIGNDIGAPQGKWYLGNNADYSSGDNVKDPNVTVNIANVVAERERIEGKYGREYIEAVVEAEKSPT